MDPLIIILPIGLAIFTAPFWAPPVWAAVSGFLTIGGRQQREVQKLFDIKVDMVCALLREGQGWTFGTYRATHPAIGIEMWVANGAGSLGVRFDGKQCHPGDGKMTRSQKRRIWSAYQGRGEDAKAAAVQLEQFLERVTKHREMSA